MPESKPSAMQQIIRDAGGIVHSDGNIFFTNEAKFLEAAAHAMQEQQAGVPAGYRLVPEKMTLRMMAAAGPAIRASVGLDGKNGNVTDVWNAILAASPSAPPVAGDERTSAAPEGLAAHAIEELCQLGYTVRDGQLIPPDNLHELARVAGWASPSGERARPVAGDSVQQPVARLQAGNSAEAKRLGLFEIVILDRDRCRDDMYLYAAPIRQAAQPSEAMPADEFRGDTPHLIECINALLSLDAKGALFPHGIGGHARTLLAAAAHRLASNPEAQQAARPVAAPDVTPCPECHGTREVLGHSDDCDSDLCALNGDMHSCAGAMEPCSSCGVAPAGAEAQQDAPAAECDECEGTGRDPDLPTVAACPVCRGSGKATPGAHQ